MRERPQESARPQSHAQPSDGAEEGPFDGADEERGVLRVPASLVREPRRRRFYQRFTEPLDAPANVLGHERNLSSPLPTVTTSALSYQRPPTPDQRLPVDNDRRKSVRSMASPIAL